MKRNLASVGALVLIGAVLTGCTYEVDGNDGGMECPDGSRPEGSICPVDEAEESSDWWTRDTPEEPSDSCRTPGELGLSVWDTCAKPRRKRNPANPPPEADLSDWLEEHYPSGRSCLDVTTYDYNWDNDVLCTTEDGEQFYTSYEGADAFLAGR